MKVLVLNKVQFSISESVWQACYLYLNFLDWCCQKIGMNYILAIWHFNNLCSKTLPKGSLPFSWIYFYSYSSRRENTSCLIATLTLLSFKSKEILTQMDLSSLFTQHYGFCWHCLVNKSYTHLTECTTYNKSLLITWESNITTHLKYTDKYCCNTSF